MSARDDASLVLLVNSSNLIYFLNVFGLFTFIVSVQSRQLVGKIRFPSVIQYGTLFESTNPSKAEFHLKQEAWSQPAIISIARNHNSAYGQLRICVRVLVSIVRLYGATNIGSG